MTSFSLDEYLKTFLNWESKLHQAASASFSLERVEQLLHVFGRPDEKMRFVHIAGTKGKGSTAVFLASILQAGGYRVGLYTSPHLYSLCERIRVLPDGMITVREIEDRLRYYHDDIEKLRASGVEITFYELMTGLAVSYFSSKKIDVVVLETGLGGRLDATNIFETSVCGITPIGFDHMNVLGHTLGEIAREKAGIIRFPEHAVTLAPQPADAMAVLKEHCAGLGIRPQIVGEDISYVVHEVSADGTRFDVDGRRKYTALVSPLTGEHQAQNAALAIGMAEDLETFGFLLTEETVRQGIASVKWPARFERNSSLPTVILDCAHTVESAAVLAQTFRAVYPGCQAVIVLGMSMDKDADGFIEALKPITAKVIFTKADNPRAMDFSGAFPVADAVNEAKRLAGKDGIILVTGSVFVCAEAGR